MEKGFFVEQPLAAAIHYSTSPIATVMFKKYRFYLLVLVVLAACHAESTGGLAYQNVQAESLAAPAEQAENAEKYQTPDNTRKLIKKGRMEIETDEVMLYAGRIRSISSSLGGYVSADELEKVEDEVRQTLELKVPANNFDRFLQAIEQLPVTVAAKNIDVEEVTTEYYDLQARLNAQQVLEIRYLKLIDRANDIESILKVEKQLVQVRQNIELAKGRLRLLDNLSGFSTLTIQLSPKIVPVQAPQYSFTDNLVAALTSGWRGLENLVVVLAHLWVLMVAVLFFLLGYKLYQKKLSLSRRPKVQQ